LDLLNAYFSVETFYLNNAALFQGKDITNVVKADWCRSLGWHYGYMLRERTLTFLNMLRGRFDAAGAAALSDLARRFKKATDAQFTERGRHVHNESEDDPLARQLGTLESFAGEHELIGRIFRARQRRVRKLIRDRVRNEGEKIQAASVDVIMQSEKFWTKLYAEIAQDAVSRAKSA
jgi:hypothetical protein